MPSNSTPVLVDRFYPTLATVVNEDEIPEILGFLKEGIVFLFDKVHFKDLQYSKSPRGDAAFYSLSIVSKNRLDIEIPGTGIFLVLNPDIDNASISSFPISIEYEWRLLSYLRSFDLDQFDFSPKAFFETALRVLSISEEQAIANFINTFTEPVNNATALEQFVIDVNNYNASANLSTPTSTTTLTDVVKEIYLNTGDFGTMSAFGTYILDNDPAVTKEKLKVFFRKILPQDIEEYIKDILIPKFKATLLLSAGIEFPRNVLKPVYPEGHANALEVIPEDSNDNFSDKVLLGFGEALFYADTEKGLGYNMDLVLNTSTPAQVGKTGLIIDIHNLKIDISRTENIVEADLDNRPTDFMGVYMERTDIFLPKKWFKKETGQTLAITGERLLIGTGGMSGTIALRATYAKNQAGNITDYFSEYFDINYPVTAILNSAPIDLQDYNSLLSHINSLDSPYDLKFQFPLSVDSSGTTINFEKEKDFFDFINAIDPNKFMWFKLGNNPERAWEIGFNRFDLTFHHGQVIESNLHAQLVIPKFTRVDGVTNADGKTIIDLKGNYNSEENFNLTASFLPNGLPLNLFGLINFTFLTIDLGEKDDSFYIGAQVDISFPEGTVIHKLTKGQVIKLPNIRVYDNGSIEIVGGNSFIPTNLSLPLGPIDIDVTGIHLGSHQQQHNGIERTYSYIGFDGAISINPVGIDARGEGVKYYYTTDNDEPALDANGDPILDNNSNPIIKEPHGFLRIQTIEVDMIIPSDAKAEDAKAIINGMLSIPEPGVSQEFIGKVSFEQRNPTGITAGADLRFMPREPAFVIEAGIELAKPIPLVGTGLSFYAFGGLLGYNYVAEKEAVGLVSGEDSWYDYYTHPRRGVNIDKFSKPPETDDYNFPFSIGAGTVLGTDGDDGFTLSTRLMLILSLPSVLILDGRMNLLGDRIKMMDRTEPPFFAGVAIGDASVELWAGADFALDKSGTFKDKLIDLYAEARAAYFKNNPSAWFIHIGTKDNPITARVLDLITAKSYIMISASGIEAGARVDFELKKRFGPAKVEFSAYLEVGGKISFERPQIGGYIALGGRIYVDIWVVSIDISLDAILSAEATKPFLIYAELRIKACIRIPFGRLCKRFTVKLKWEKNKTVERTPIPPLTFENAPPYKLDKSEDLVKGVHMLTSEVFDLKKLSIVESGTSINVNNFINAIDKIIPIDTYIDVKSNKSLDPTGVNLSSNSLATVGGNTHGADNFIDLIPPERTVRGGRELRQVKHKYSIEKLEIKALDKNGNWQNYHPFEAVVKESDRAQFANSPVGFWQKSDKKYNTIRIPSTHPFQYTENGSPGSFVPEHHGITPSDLFCQGEFRDYTCSDFVDEPIGKIYYNPTQFEAHYIDQAFYALNFDNFLVVGTGPNGGQNVLENTENFFISNDSNPFNKSKSIRFDNYSELVVKLPQAAKKIKLSLQTYSDGVTIQFYKSNGYANDEVIHTEFHSVHLDRNQLNTSFEYESPNDLISKILITPDRADATALENAQNQLNNYISNFYNNQTGTLTDVANDSQYISLLDNYNNLKAIACTTVTEEISCEKIVSLCELYEQLWSLFQERFEFPITNPDRILEIQEWLNQFNQIFITYTDENPEPNLIDVLKPVVDTYNVFHEIVSGWNNVEVVSIDTYYQFRNSTYQLLLDIKALGNCDCENGEITVNKCYTTVQEVCWLSIEDYEYNLTIPSIAEIQEEQTQMLDTLHKVALPVWRPDTKYYIKFRLKDEVDNESSPGKSWDYYYGFKTVGPLGFYQDHPDVDYLAPGRNEDSYALTTLKQYIDYQRSYPQANGNLLKAKPLFYGNEEARIELFFVKPFVQHMLNNWNEYLISGSNGFDALNGAMSIAIKDPVSEEIIPYPLPINYDAETVPIPQEEWVDDQDPRIPSTILFLNNMIDRINENNNAINCQLTIGDPISPAQQNFRATLTNLKPQKLYTAIIYNNYAGTSTDFERKKIHEFVFQTSRFSSFEEQINSFKLSVTNDEGTITEEKDLVIPTELSLSNLKVETIGSLIKNESNGVASDLEADVSDPFDRVMDTLLEQGTIDPPITGEFNVIKNVTDGSIVGLVYRNPEPLNSPLIPTDIIYNGSPIHQLVPSVQILKNDGTVDGRFSILHSKDRSQFIICKNSMNIDHQSMNIRLSHIKWNGANYEESDSVLIENLIIN